MPTIIAFARHTEGAPVATTSSRVRVQPGMQAMLFLPARTLQYHPTVFARTKPPPKRKRPHLGEPTPEEGSILTG